MMKIVFILNDGRRIEPPPGYSSTVLTRYADTIEQVRVEPDDVESVKWCEDLWKLEDKR